MFKTIIILIALSVSSPPRPVIYNWREAGGYPFHNGIQSAMQERDAGLRIAQPGTSVALSDGDIRTPEQWLILVIENWLRDDSEHVMDGNLWRDGKVNYTDFAVISRWWRYEQETNMETTFTMMQIESEKTELDTMAQLISCIWMVDV